MQSFSSLNCPESTEKNTFHLLTKLFPIQGILTWRHLTLSNYLLNEGTMIKGNRGGFVQISVKLQNILTIFIFIFFFCYFLSLFLSLFFFICSEFCHTLELNSHGFTCVPCPGPPSHRPLHPLPLGFPSAPGPSACLMHPTWAGDLLHPRYHTCLDAVLLKHPTLSISHRV